MNTALGTRPAIAMYATGFFSLSVLPMSNFLIPLWAIHIGASPAMIDLAVGARSVLPVLLLLTAVGGATVAIASTPLTTDLGWLSALAVLFGLLAGPGFPLILSELAREVDVSQQGICVGLRTTVNRTVALVAPITMGVIAELVSLLASFLVLAVLNLALVSVLAARWPQLQRRRARPVAD